MQRRVSATGVIIVCRQRVALGRVHAGRTVTVHVAEHTLAVELDDGETRKIRRTTSRPVVVVKVNRPHPAASRDNVNSTLRERRPETRQPQIQSKKTATATPY